MLSCPSFDLLCLGVALSVPGLGWGWWTVTPAPCRLDCGDQGPVFQAAKLAKMKIPPSEMFLSESDKYSKFDENVRIFLFFSEPY